jgi:hypothetical protein
MHAQDPIDVRRYDAVVSLLTENPGIDFEEAAQQTGVAPATIKKIWEGTISRPSVVVLDRLRTRRRCPDCGVLCREWPCISCEMRRRKSLTRPGRLRFVYRTQVH